jgi:membrane-bound lytic murein transglycosylase D
MFWFSREKKRDLHNYKLLKPFIFLGMLKKFYYFAKKTLHKMSISKSLFSFISLFFSFILLFSQPSPAVKDYSKLLEGSKTVELFDSLANSKFFHSSLFREDMSLKIKYTMPSNYIPEYGDSLIRERIADMNAASPIEFRFNEDVMAHIDFYLKRRSFLSRLLGLSDLYFPMFDEMLDKYDLPRELKYVTIIESALNPIARSRAGASGLWQFMLKTGEMYGLNSNSYVDDRFDPYKATDAACRHFKDLYRIYGDWALCLAAYNAGAGRINRAIKQSNNRFDYWIIRSVLPRETQKYVPAYIAATYVFTYATEHNIRPLVPVIIDAKIDTVSVRAELSFTAISNVLDIPIEQVELLNPAYKKQLIPAPAQNVPYMLRLPKNKVLKFIDEELNMYYLTYATKYPELLTEYITPSGNTIFKGDYRTEASASANDAIDSTSSSKLPVLKTIKNHDELLTLVRNYDPSGKAAVRPTTSGTTTSSSSSTSSSPTGSHRVQSGESLGVIARKYNCTIEQIMQWNNLSSQTIHPGQVLKVSGSSSASTSSTTTTSSGGNVTWYTVKSGDSLWSIANRHSTTVDKIKADNNLKSDNLQVGQKIKIVK